MMLGHSTPGAQVGVREMGKGVEPERQLEGSMVADPVEAATVAQLPVAR